MSDFSNEFMAPSIEDLDRRLAARLAREQVESRVEPDIEGRDIGSSGGGVIHLANGQQANIPTTERATFVRSASE